MTSPEAATTEAVTDLVSGLVAPVTSTAAWVEGLRRLSRDDALAETLRREARRWVEQNFDAHRNTERVPIDELEGRITTALITPYPPGIPLLIPGEVFNRKIVDYLKFSREFNQQCPGFETDIHGLVVEEGFDGQKRYFADCVKA